MPSKRSPLKKQKAVIGHLDPGDTVTQSPSNLCTATAEIIERVKKCYNRAYHQKANEAEAQAAIMMMHKYVNQYNIQKWQYDEHEKERDRITRRGESTVNVEPAKEDGVPIIQGWMRDLVSAILKFFDCSAYSVRYKTQIVWTFYGIALHTVSAAMAFEMVHNLVVEWAAQKHHTVASRNSYSLGVARGLCNMADEEEGEMTKAARETEQRALAARIWEEDLKEQDRLYRLRNPSPPPPPQPTVEDISDKADDDEGGKMDCDEPVGEGDDDASDHGVVADYDDGATAGPEVVVDTTADFETELNKFIIPDRTIPSIDQDYTGFEDSGDEGNDTEMLPPPRPTQPDEDEDSKEMLQWKSERQLTAFREQSVDIAKQYLEEKGVKLKTAKKRKRSVKDRAVYREGREDAKSIDVKARRIEDAEHENGADGDNTRGNDETVADG